MLSWAWNSGWPVHDSPKSRAGPARGADGYVSKDASTGILTTVVTTIVLGYYVSAGILVLGIDLPFTELAPQGRLRRWNRAAPTKSSLGSSWPE